MDKSKPSEEDIEITSMIVRVLRGVPLEDALKILFSITITRILSVQNFEQERFIMDNFAKLLMDEERHKYFRANLHLIQENELYE